LPQLRQAVSQHPVITTIAVMTVLLLLLGLYTMGFTQSSGGMSIR
jgi:hypothetical protein